MKTQTGVEVEIKPSKVFEGAVLVRFGEEVNVFSALDAGKIAAKLQRAAGATKHVTSADAEVFVRCLNRLRSTLRELPVPKGYARTVQAVIADVDRLMGKIPESVRADVYRKGC